MEIWLTKLEDYLGRHSVAEVKDWLAKFGVSAPVASFQGGILASQGERRKEAWDLFRRRLEICQAVGIGTIVIACDVPQPLSQETIERVQVSLVQAAQECGKRGLRAALEFQATSSFGNNLQTAAALIAEVGSPHLGICLDAFHFFTGPSKTEDLSYLTTSNLFHVQLCDLLDTPREHASDTGRILPGDGDFQLQPLIEHLRSIGYAGCVSLELLNPQLWQVPPRQLGEIGMTALRKILGQAAM
ncbi:MAG: sugar phosphate isomerase/epimerase [Planctomycetales bacterium]|nr:sugar phosphate isomerase/epimerase [Planctomycetales bacterium]